MRIAEVIGTVTLSHAHASLTGGRLKFAVPLTLENLVGTVSPHADAVVIYDELGAGISSRIMLSEGAEASQAFYPAVKPIDAYNAGILEEVHINIDQSSPKS